MKIISKAPTHNYRICNRCVMDTTDPWINFNEDGLCNHCNNFFEHRLGIIAKQKDSKDTLNKMFSEIKRTSRSKSGHHVVIGVSGGVDSSMVLFLAQKAGLRILAVHMDNCWDTPTSVKNIKKLISLKNVDYECNVLNWNKFKYLQRAFIESGLPDIELPTDIAIQSILNKTAIKHGIKIILGGGNISNEGILPSAWMYNPRDSLFANSVLKKGNVPISFFNECKNGFRDELIQRLIFRIRTLYPLNQFEYDKEQARHNLIEKIGWENYAGKHCESRYTRFCQLIYQPKRHKMDYRRAHLSTDICLGRITRKEALIILNTPPWANLDVDNELQFISYKLGYNVSDMYEFMKQPPLWYKDFPNREKLLRIAYNTYRLFTGKNKHTANF
tara:strand:+ start:261 stop:1421 length:1161 start_codon:yes stop_codon:yes gene_type:complete